MTYIVFSDMFALERYFSDVTYVSLTLGRFQIAEMAIKNPLRLSGMTLDIGHIQYIDHNNFVIDIV